MSATKQTTKPATSKGNKATTKPATKPATLVYAAILSEALAGRFGTLLQGFYTTAIKYHAKQKTTFPRARLVGIALLNDKDARDFLTKHQSTGLPAGSYTGQKLFDAMIQEAPIKA